MTPATRARLQELVEEWRREAARLDSVHATMGIGYKVCAHALAACLAAEGEAEPQGWQLIATVPKDGTNFLAVSHASAVFYAHWANGVVDSSSFSDDWGYHSRFATHWMPLPAPPVASPAAPEGE
jgi:hypothetical protein